MPDRIDSVVASIIAVRGEISNIRNEIIARIEKIEKQLREQPGPMELMAIGEPILQDTQEKPPVEEPKSTEALKRPKRITRRVKE